jgi:hypothetical protein
LELEISEEQPTCMLTELSSRKKKTSDSDDDDDIVASDIF